MLENLKQRLQMYLSSGGNASLNHSLIHSFNIAGGNSLFQPSLLNTSLNQTGGGKHNQSVISSNATFDLYKLNMSKDMAVLRRNYDRVKNETRQRRERLQALEREWDSLHTLNERDNAFKVHVGPGKDLKKSTVFTADLGTERKDEIVDLDRLKSHILVQRSKLTHAEEKLNEVLMEKWSLQEMFKKSRDQADADRLTQNVLTTRVQEMNKVFQ